MLRAAIILGATNMAAVTIDLEAKHGRRKVRGSLEEAEPAPSERRLVEFLGRFGDEVTLLRLAAQLERAKPWRIQE